MNKALEELLARAVDLGLLEEKAAAVEEDPTPPALDDPRSLGDLLQENAELRSMVELLSATSPPGVDPEADADAADDGFDFDGLEDEAVAADADPGSAMAIDDEAPVAEKAAAPDPADDIKALFAERVELGLT